MARYIELDALLAKIEKRKNEWSYGSSTEAKYKVEAYNEVIELLDTLEVKEVDLEKAIDAYIYTHDGRKRLALEPNWKYCNLTLKGGDEIIKFAEHFFELGLKAQKGE